MSAIVMLSYATPLGIATYIGGSGLTGEPQYTIAGRVLAHSAVLALVYSTADSRTDTRRWGSGMFRIGVHRACIGGCIVDVETERSA